MDTAARVTRVRAAAKNTFTEPPSTATQAVLVGPLFVCWFISHKGFITHPKLSKDFQRSKESHFWCRIPVILVPILFVYELTTWYPQASIPS